LTRLVLPILFVATAVACGGSSPAVQPPTDLVYATNPADYTVMVPVAPNAPTSGGGAVASYAVSGVLPAGLYMDTVTGIIAGTPTAITSATTYLVTATNAGGSANANVTISVRGVGLSAICSFPEPEVDSGQCVYPAACQPLTGATPALDVDTARLDFVLPVRIDNTLVATDAQVQSFEVTYPDSAVASRTVIASVPVPAGGSSTAVVSLVALADFGPLTPPAGETTRIRVNVRAIGIQGSQRPFTTAWFTVPVDVCGGCLAGGGCPPGLVTLSCPAVAAGASAPGQTATVTCIP
jgi:hypothetical protein